MKIKLKKDVFLIWCGVVYLLITTTKILSFWIIQDPEKLRDDSANFFVTVIGNLIAFFFLVYIWPHRLKVLSLMKQQWPIFLLLFFALTSCLWSEFPVITIRRWFKVAFFSAFIMALKVSDSFYDNLKIVIFKYGIITIITSFILIFVFPEYGWMVYENKMLPMGIFAHKGLLGQFAVLIILLFMMFSNKSNKNIFWIFCAFLLLMMTETKGALISLITVLCVLFYIKTINQNKLTFFLYLFFLLISMYVGLYLIFQKEPIKIIIEQVLVLINKDSTLTGRTLLWEVLLSIGMKNPFLGVGYRVFFNGSNSAWLIKYLEWDCTNAHNGFLQAFLELGAIGVFLFVVSLIWLLIKIVKNLQENNFQGNSLWVLVLFIQYAISNFYSDCFLSERFCVFVFLLIPNLIKKNEY